MSECSFGTYSTCFDSILGLGSTNTKAMNESLDRQCLLGSGFTMTWERGGVMAAVLGLVKARYSICS